MYTIAITVLVMSLQDTNTSSSETVRTLIATIESLLEPLKDFRCEFEGTVYYHGAVAVQQKVSSEEPGDDFSGLFIWKQGGDIRSEVLHQAPDGTIRRDTLIARARKGEAEFSSRLGDAPTGPALISRLEDVDTATASVLGQIFLIEQLKRLAGDERRTLSVSDGELDGRSVKILDVGLRDIPNRITGRYWIDLSRSGQVVQAEGYAMDGAISGRLKVTLEPFKIGASEVWIPVSGVNQTYVAAVDGKPVISEEPTVITNIKVLRGTLQFNKRPDARVFTAKYKPGTPISDELRKMTYEFGQQTIGRTPSRDEAKTMLDEQLALAESQKKELVASPASEGFAWSVGLPWAFGAAVLVSLVALMIQRRRH